MTLPAYIYARYSSAEQSKGHSLKRQLERGKSFIEKKGWLYSKDREIVDEGRSAYHGANRAEGSALHDFEQKARAGHFTNGAVLVVENIDRLSRQGYEEIFGLVQLFTNNGVTLALTQGENGRIFEAGKRLELGQVITVVVEAELSREESEKKSKRIAAAWQEKIDKAIAGDRTAMTKILPAWLERDPETKMMKPIPHRVAVLNEIYDWYIDGRGLPYMVQQLNGRNEPTWGYGKKKDSAGWNTAYLHKLLIYRAVLGDFCPMARPRSSNVETSKGIVIPNYYPQVITAEKFNRVQALRAQRQKWGGPATKQMKNLFSGIARCASCGGMMYFEHQHRKDRKTYYKRKSGEKVSYIAATDRSYMRCNNNRRGHKCDNSRIVRYEFLETAVLDTLFDFSMRDIAFKPSDIVQRLTLEIAERERLLDIKRQQLEQGSANLLEVFSKTLAQNVARLEAEIEEDEKTLSGAQQRLLVERGNARPEEDLNALVEARRALKSENDDERYAARAKTHQSLKKLISEMYCGKNGETNVSFNQHTVHMTFDADGRAYGVVYQGPDGEEDWTPDVEAAE